MGQRTVQLEILDTAGQDVCGSRMLPTHDIPCAVTSVERVACVQDFESLRPQWMMERDAYVFVFALDARESLNQLEPFYELHCQINDTTDVPIVLCGTKADIVVRGGGAGWLPRTSVPTNIVHERRRRMRASGRYPWKKPGVSRRGMEPSMWRRVHSAGKT